MNSSPSHQPQPEQPTSDHLQPDNTPPEDSSELTWPELEQMGYPKEDHDPATGQTFETYPEGLFRPSHPLVHDLPDSARPENWRDLDSAAFNPSKARKISGMTPEPFP